MQIKMPFGVRPAFHTSGQGNPRVQMGTVASQPAKSLYQNMPVKIDANGVVVPIDTVTDQVFAIFVGLQYIDVNGLVKERNQIAAGTPLFGNGSPEVNNGDAYTSVGSPYLYQDPAMEFAVQANGPMARSSIGKSFNIDLTTMAAASGVGISKALLDNTAVAALAGQFIVTELENVPGNTWGDPFTIVKVKFNNIL